ncbi:hypothetical protein G7Y89_g2770 [Cudoniella acicularis]|uniref:Uncharacterized protein n=1 Tax=Cudoniella acicularis TaxID=354080 RepID=A0A8H4RTY0_9HELO|nr:hypothetical protein G7Y89_g2770 [Cudoniella acicularis]
MTSPPPPKRQRTRPPAAKGSTQSWFIDQLYKLPERLGLSRNAQELLKSLDEVQQGSMEAVDLGRMLRLSLPLRQAIPQIVNQCLDFMKGHPEEATICFSTIQKCGELVDFIDIKPPKGSFPFLKLPLEIRNKIYDIKFGSQDTINPFVRDNVKDLRFHWRGEAPDVAIPKLMLCPELKTLVIRISKSTTVEVTKREQKMRKFFRVQKHNVRLSDALGIDELLMIRGLDVVLVKHAPVKVASKRSDEDMWNLQCLLGDELTKAKPADYGSPSSQSLVGKS